MTGKRMILAAALLALPMVGARSLAASGGPGHVVEVKMVKEGSNYAFSPANVTVQPGDTIRWIEASDAPHNVQFDSWPKGAKLGGAQMGTFLSAPGERYQLVIDGRFTAGKYAYECTPHGVMGMKATITVAP